MVFAIASVIHFIVPSLNHVLGISKCLFPMLAKKKTVKRRSKVDVPIQTPDCDVVQI
jgi:hypothetical protein